MTAEAKSALAVAASRLSSKGPCVVTGATYTAGRRMEQTWVFGVNTESSDGSSGGIKACYARVTTTNLIIDPDEVDGIVGGVIDLVDKLGLVAHSLLGPWDDAVPTDYKYVPRLGRSRWNLVLVPVAFDDSAFRERLRSSLSSVMSSGTGTTIGFVSEFRLADEFSPKSHDGLTRLRLLDRVNLLYRQRRAQVHVISVWLYRWERQDDVDDPAGDAAAALLSAGFDVRPGDVVQEFPGYRSDGLAIVGRDGVARRPITLGNGEAGIPAWAVEIGLERGSTLADLLRAYCEHTTASFVVYPLIEQRRRGTLRLAPGGKIESMAVYHLHEGKDAVMEEGHMLYDDLDGDLAVGQVFSASSAASASSAKVYS